MNKIIFVVIADREITFYCELASILTKKYNMNIEFLSFYEPKEKILKKNFKVVSFYQFLKINNRKINIDKDVIFHESVTFGISNKKKLEEKYKSYLDTLIYIYKPYKENLIFIHELGGWIAPQTVKQMAIELGHKNVFLEPSFFKGKLDFLINRNKFFGRKYLKINDYSLKEIKNFYEIYQKQFLNKGKYIIPEKDIHNFKSIKIQRLFNFTNLIKILYKFIQKNLLKKNFEYQHYLNYIKRYFIMLVNKKRLEKLYTDKVNYSEKKKYIFYPIHFSLDFSITIRAKQYFNQIKLIEKILDVLPSNTILLIKEHPVSAGLFKYHEISTLIKKNKNLKIINPYKNIYEFLHLIDLVITINSKVGFEAILSKIKTICLSDSFYFDFVDSEYNNISKIGISSNLNNDDDYNQEQLDMLKFKYYNNLIDGELYVNDSDNLSKLAISLNKLTNLIFNDFSKY